VKLRHSEQKLENGREVGRNGWAAPETLFEQTTEYAWMIRHFAYVQSKSSRH